MKILDIKVLENSDAVLRCFLKSEDAAFMEEGGSPAVLVCPGGAYLFLSEREGEAVALSYAAKGFQAFVLYYSVGEKANDYQPLKEVSAAINIIRQNAEQWHLNPKKIAACGFSAGGHLAGAAGLLTEHRVNAMILGYPAVNLGIDGSEEVKGSPVVKSLLGQNVTQERLDKGSLHLHVTKEAPPMFLWHTSEDMVVKPIQHGIRLAEAYAREELPFEYHVFQSGQHGLSLATPEIAGGSKSNVDKCAEVWFDMSVDWLRQIFGEIELRDKEVEIPIL